MLFNSLQFALFFPIVTIAYFALPRAWRWVLLLVASYVFYMAWKPVYGLMLFASTALDWYVALRLPGAASQGRRRAWLAVSLVGNLGMLFSFKYWNLVNGTAAALVGPGWPLPNHDWLLPVGISFYTFQTMSYTIDVYRGTLAPEPNLARFALYVSFFPQLVAGPIERATNLLPQLQRSTDLDWDRVASGLRLAAWGLFKKVVVADRLAILVNAVYGDPHAFSGFAYVVATAFFAFQVYCDFSGYSDVAVGVARVLGFDLMKNFDQPYGSRSMSELWTRWHVSLSTWFRDYLYFPLGGNRVGFPRWALNVMIVFVTSGVWHGAEWRFAIWGALNGLALVLDRLTMPLRDRFAEATGLQRSGLRTPISIALTFGLWLVTLVPFRAETTADVGWIYAHVWQGWAHVGELEALVLFLSRVNLDLAHFLYCLLLIPLVEGVDWARRKPEWAAWLEGWPTAARWALDYLLIVAILLLGHWVDTPFVYFQF